MMLKLYFKFFSLNIVFSLFLLFFLFFLNSGNYEYYLCNQLTKISFLNYSMLIPFSCDAELYIFGIENFNEIISFDYNYQERPIYILFLKLISIIPDLFFKDIIAKYFASFLLLHLIVLSFVNLITYKIYEYKLSLYNLFFVNLLIVLNPIFKFGLFDSAHQTLTILSFFLCVYFMKLNNLENKKIINWSFLLGCLYLSNTTFAISFLFIFFKDFDLKKVTFNFYKGIAFIIPYFSWNIYIYSSGYIPYNSAIERWYQFKWLPAHIINGYENVKYSINQSSYDNSEFYCMSLPENFICYFKDFINSIQYLSVPLLFVLLYLLKKSFFKNEIIVKNLAFVFITHWCFWSLIGWYPPLRFNLYSLAPFLTLISIFIFLKEKRQYFKFLFLIGNTAYFLYLNHWNYVDVVKFNNSIYFSFCIFAISSIVMFKYRNQPV